MTAKGRSDIRRKLRILKHAQKTGNVSKTCRYFLDLKRNFLSMEEGL